MPSGSLLGPRGARLICDMLAGGSVSTVPRARHVGEPFQRHGWQVFYASTEDGENALHVVPGLVDGLDAPPRTTFTDRTVGAGVYETTVPQGSWWICLSCYTVSGAFVTRLAITTSAPAWNNTDLFPNEADQGVSSSYSFGEFKTVCRQWRVLAHSADGGMIQDHIGTASFNFVYSDIMAAENGLPGTGLQKSGMIERKGNRIRLCFDYQQALGNATYLLGIGTDGDGIWHLVRVSPPSGTESITYLGADGRPHTIDVYKA